MSDRTLLSVTGADAEPFLQGLVSNDVGRARDGIIYAALLTPQGKYLADFFVVGQPGGFVIDVAASLGPALVQRLTMYKLRAKVQIAPSGLMVSRGTGPAPAGAVPDPRHPALGWRLYGDSDLSAQADWDALRVAHCIPETGIELTADSYILECGFERLHGVDFRKGCYVGQEVTARMKHKTDLRKGLATVQVSGPADPGTPITSEDRPAGTLLTRAGDLAIAYLRFDRTTDLRAGQAEVTLH